MPHKPNPEKSDLSVTLGVGLRKRFLAACHQDEISLSTAAKTAIKRWLDSRERKIQRIKFENRELPLRQQMESVKDRDEIGN